MKKLIFTLTLFCLLSFKGIAQPATGLDFDGANDYVFCGNVLSPSYTKEAWINTSSLAGFNNIISSAGTGQHAFWAPSIYGGRLSAGHNFTWNFVQDPNPLPTNIWVHVAVTYDATTTTMRLYNNGNLVSINTAVPPHVNGNDVSVGAYGSAATFIGIMDEARIWNRPLCQAEILNNINCSLNPTGQSGLTALYRFDQGIVNADNTTITSLIDASGNGNNGVLANFALTGATSNWAVGTVSGTCSPYAPTTLAGTAGGGPAGSTIIVNASGTNYIADNCGLITNVLPSGASPVTGSILSKVTIDASVQTYLGAPYLQRHYDIEPATNAATATATVVLYYTQAEFNAYNLARGSYLPLPVGPADATGIANVRITQYHGVGTAPANYPGPIETINPNDANIVWNATLSRWEITIPVNGFSGFYLQTEFGGTLPVNLVSFNGRSNGQYNKLQWITSAEQNSDYFDLERSTDGINYSKVASLPAQNFSTSTKYYSVDDLRSNSNIHYYRLKMIDKDGGFKYSDVIKISNKENSVITIAPNPASEKIIISVSDTKLLRTAIRITDINGRLMSISSINNTQQPVDVSRLSSGMYFIQFEDGSSTKFIKQ
jgi:hypothetical protein